MIKVTVTPKEGANLYGLLVRKEVELRHKKQGTLHRLGVKQKDRDKWTHARFSGWIWFQKCLGGVLVAVVQAKDEQDEWQLLSSFIGFLHRHFRHSINSISLGYEAGSE